MQVKKIFCDHCGKEFNLSSGVKNIDINIYYDVFRDVDLCTDCYTELTKMVAKFIDRDEDRGVGDE